MNREVGRGEMVGCNADPGVKDDANLFLHDCGGPSDG
jgi:hypothetical protein